MPPQAIEIQGILKEDGTLVLDQKPSLPPGRVKVTVEPVSASEQTEIQQFFERLWAEQRSKGHIPRTREEIDAERETAHQEDEERMRELERIHEEGQRHRQQLDPSSKPCSRWHPGAAVSRMGAYKGGTGMLRILGRTSAACDGLTRRDLLRAGSLALLGGVSGLTPVAAGKAPARKGAARSVILIDLFGGPSHIDTFDLKPEAPVEVRGEFKPIASSLTGLQVCEHLPRLARLMHRTSLIRTVSHGYNSHNPYAVMSGYTGGRDVENYFARATDHPGMGAVCQYFGVHRRRDVPGYVVLPAYPGYSQGLRRAGPYGGYLGGRYDPLFSACQPTFDRPNVDANKDFYDHTLTPMGDPTLPQVEGGLTVDALDRRRTLLEQFDDQAAALRSSKAADVMASRQREAFELLLSRQAREAFDLGREGPKLRERYGRDLFGSSALLARRLVEAGVTFVTIHTESKPNGHWDTHSNNFKMLRHWLLPYLDRSVSALLEDLDMRGLLATTLVVVTGDMGRTPRVNAQAGRDHWPQCGFCLLFGGGVKEGYVHGSTDKQAGYPREFPVTPGDLCATIYQQLGVDPEATVPDHTSRPTAISHGGSPIWKVLT